MGNAVGFNGEREGAGAIIHAVAAGIFDFAIVWGPVAGYYRGKEQVPLRLSTSPAFDTRALPLRFAISMGVRKMIENCMIKCSFSGTPEVRNQRRTSKIWSSYRSSCQ